MSNAIETELLKASGLKKKVGETYQKFAKRLIEAVHEIPEDEWEALSDDAQSWHAAGTKAINVDKDIPRFPSDEPEEEPAEEKPRARTSRRAAEEEEPQAEEAGAEEAEPQADEEDKPAPRGRTARARSREVEEPDEKPARGRTRAAAEEEEKPARGRSRRAAEEEEPAPRKAAKSAPRGRASDTKAPSATTLLKKMLMKNPKMSSNDILAELEDKHGLTPTPMAISSIRSAFIHSMKVLNDAGHLSEKMADKL